MKCFNCDQEGHAAYDCKWENEIGDPGGDRPWCGVCEPRTRQLHASDGTLSRCPDCHPLRDKMLPQHTRCKGCRTIIYIWDTADCDRHIKIGPQPYIGRPDPGPRPDRREEAARQVAEFRASPAYPGTIPTHTPPPIANTLPGD